MKLLRIGVFLLVVGVSFLVATNLRARSIDSEMGSFDGVFGPYLFEPRQTIIVLREVEPSENLTVAVVNARCWNPTQDIKEADPAFVFSGLRQSDAVVFKTSVRGLYYVVVTTETDELTGATDLAVEQRGYAEDLLWISGSLAALGIAIVVVDRVKMLRRCGSHE
jgi:hypothetical protein